MKCSIKIGLAAIILIICGLVIYDISHQPYTGPSHIEDPIQEDITERTIQYIDKNGQIVDITLFASYKTYSGVKGIKNYKTDGASSVSPKDFILTWGDLNDILVDEHITYSQSNRWYFYRYSSDSIVGESYISSHSANTHIIPENDSILKQIKSVKENDYILIEGYLAIVHFDNGDWQSSASRLDTGDGACEILYVTNIEIF